MSFFENASNWLTALFTGKPFGSSGIADTIEAFARDYGIDIVPESVTDIAGVIKHDKIDRAIVQPACRMIRSELGIYSKRSVENICLRKVVLGANVQHNNKPVGGLCLGNLGTLYIAADRLRNWNGSRRTFHHELFHCLDYHDDDWRYYDPIWSALNGKDFKYGEEQYKIPNKFIPYPGFVSNYAMTAVHEDKAELFSYMIVHMQTVADMAKNDSLLANKVVYMKRLTNRVCKEFNDRFWDERLKQSVPPEIVKLDVLMSLSIHRDLISGANEIWTLTRKDIPNAKPVAFYNYAQLADTLKKLGMVEFDEVANLNQRSLVEVKIRTSKKIIEDLGLH